jgi:uncharacterized membrane protein
MGLFKLLHLLSVIVWVGGMFFAYMALRPVAADVLQPPERLRLWDGVFRRFFNWVWLSVGLILVSGLYMVYLYGGMVHTPHYVHVMLLLGLIMMGIYSYVFFACYVPLSVHVGKQRWPEAGAILGKIRKLVGLNLLIGIMTVVLLELMRG